MNFIGAQQFETLHVKQSPATGLPLRQKRADAPLVGVRKEAIEAVEKIGDGTLGFTISTSAIDRDQARSMSAAGSSTTSGATRSSWWSHKADELPVGKVVGIGSDDSRLTPPSSSSLAAMARRPTSPMSSTGSCRWLALRDQRRLPAPRMGLHRGRDARRERLVSRHRLPRTELVELSICCVPSNPEALIDGAIPIEPGGGDNGSAPVISPAPVQLLDFERYRRRVRAASVGISMPDDLLKGPSDEVPRQAARASAPARTKRAELDVLMAKDDGEEPMGDDDKNRFDAIMAELQELEGRIDRCERAIAGAAPDDDEADEPKAEGGDDDDDDEDDDADEKRLRRVRVRAKGMASVTGLVARGGMRVWASPRDAASAAKGSRSRAL